PSVTLGFPEVQLGAHPGFGGTVGAVQLIGPLAAMDLMLTGKSVRPQKALQLGLVDRVVPREQLDAAAKELALRAPKPRTLGLKDRLLNSAPMRAIVAGQMRTRVAKRVKPAHYPAPYALIDLWQRHGGRGARAMEAEARSMAALRVTPTSQNLVRVFFLQERLKSGGKFAGPPAEHVHVVGAGVMGGDIATCWAARARARLLREALPGRRTARRRACTPASRRRGSRCRESGRRDRGHFRESRGEARALRPDRAANEARRRTRDEHLEHRPRTTCGEA